MIKSPKLTVERSTVEILFAQNETGESQFNDLWIMGIACQCGVRVDARKTFINNIDTLLPFVHIAAKVRFPPVVTKLCLSTKVRKVRIAVV